MLFLQGLATPAARADEPKAVLQGKLPEDLREALERAIGESENPPGSRLEARRRARDAAQDAIALLRSEGYYGYQVEPDVTEAEPGQAVVTIDPGPRFLLANPTIVWTAEVPEIEIRELGDSALDLDVGKPGRAADVVAAEGRVLGALQGLGFADAAAEPRDVVVDHADNTLRPEFRISAGAIVQLDGIDLRTDGRTNPVWVRRLAPWREGDVYDPADVAELERRLLDAGVYESVTVALAPRAEGVVKRPVIVSLADRPRRTIELGAGYSTTEGIGLDGRLSRFNRRGLADTETYLFRYAEIERRLDGEISFAHWRRPQYTLKLGGGVFQNLTDAYDDIGVGVRADITKRYSRTSYRTVGVSVDLTRTDEKVPVVRTLNQATIAGLGIIALDRSDDPLNPRHGWRIEGRAEPTYSLGDISAAYLRIQGQVAGYYPFLEEGRAVAAGRLRLGSVIGASLADIPAARRLYAGGGGSVRGYAYQGVGPRLPDEVTPRGGLGLFEASGEIRYRVTERWGAVAFIDVGGISDSEVPDFSNVSTGIGAGVRYDLGFGPIRADVAIPLTKRKGDPSYQIYLSIGQSF